MILMSGKLFKFRYAVNGSVKPPVVIHALNMTDADAAVLLYAAEQPGYNGEEVHVLSATEIDVSAL